MFRKLSGFIFTVVMMMVAAASFAQDPYSASGPNPVRSTATPPPNDSATVSGGPNGATENSSDTFDKGTILAESESYLGAGAEGLAVIIEKVFKELGEPNAYVKGNEAGGALVFGLRYGSGTLIMKNGLEQMIHWQGPSLGFDIGGNASKVFTLVYNLPNVDSIFQRFPGVDGSLYFVGGVGVNYLQSDSIVLAPIRLGVGWRQGINVGYLNIRREKSWNPF